MVRADIIEKVKQKIDEVSSFNDAKIDTVDQIDNFLDDATDIINIKAPSHLLTSSDIPTTGLVDNGDNTGHIALPSDFLRLHSFKMGVWKESVIEPITNYDPRYKFQKYVATRGGINKPIVVIHHRMSGGKLERCLEYYSVIDDDHGVDHATYVKDEVAENLADILVEPLAWQCAADVLQAFGDPEGSALARKKVEEFITINKFLP